MNNNEIMVSVFMLSYNHENYIREAIESVLMQKTNFKFEIIIHDDASTDNSAQIIREYELKYPDIIKPIYQTENQYSKGVKIIFKYMYPLKKGKYIAVCECDDYWTDGTKLQRQVDFLENNPQYSCVTHKFVYVDENSQLSDARSTAYFDYNGDYIYTISDLENDKLPNQTATKLYRDYFAAMSESERELFLNSNLVGDRKNVIALLKMGNIYCMDCVMSAYRMVFKGGSWTALHKGGNYINYFEMYEETEKLAKAFLGYKLNYKEYKDGLVFKVFERVLTNPTKENGVLFIKIFRKSKNKFPLFIEFSKRVIEGIIRRFVRAIKRIYNSIG